MKRVIFAAAVAMFSLGVAAQGPGTGPGPGPGAGAGVGPGPGAGMGPGMGPRAGMGPGMGGSNWQFGPRNTDGWALMTPAERAAHRTKMLGLTSYDECVAYTAQHHAQMQARAAEKGVATRPQPRQNMCERMKSAGRLK